MGFEFHPDDHTGWLDGQQLPSVTTILRDQGIVSYADVPEGVLERARLRGTAAHQAIMFANEGALDPSSVAEELEPFLFAYEGFRAATGFVPVFFEQPLHDPILRFFGIPDAAGPVNGELAVVDFKPIKTMSQPSEVQLAAYRLLLRVAGYPVEKRFVVQLKQDGTYRLHPCPDALDEAEFRSALFCWQRKMARNGGCR